MTDIKIIPTQKAHLDEICAIENVCFSSPWSKNSFAFGLDNSQTQSYYTAISENKVVGYICIFHLFEEGELLNIAIHPDYRKLGIGQKLIDKMFDILKEKGIERVTLEVRDSNIPARKLYTKNGFSQFAVRKNYYTKPLEDGIIMEKHI